MSCPVQLPNPAYFLASGSACFPQQPFPPVARLFGNPTLAPGNSRGMHLVAAQAPSSGAGPLKPYPGYLRPQLSVFQTAGPGVYLLSGTPQQQGGM